jgi:NAD(P)-dependent dehydrogenase (short-subunit alcohol dehydrogenase family)
MNHRGIRGIVAITGANSGLGYEQARFLYCLGYHVVMICRAKADIALRKIIHSVGSEGNRRLSIIIADLNSQESIKHACESFKYPITSLILNAAHTYPGKDTFNDKGIEETFAVNHVGHFYLSVLLLKKHRKSLHNIVVISSDAHDPESSSGSFPSPHIPTIASLAYPDETHKSTNDNSAQRYVNSKLCNIWFAYELVRQLQKSNRNDVLVNILNPGFVPVTNLKRHSPLITRIFMHYIASSIGFAIENMQKPIDVARNIRMLLEDTHTTGGYYSLGIQSESSKESYDEAKAKELWKFSLQLCNLPPDFIV